MQILLPNSTLSISHLSTPLPISSSSATQRHNQSGTWALAQTNHSTGQTTQFIFRTLTAAKNAMLSLAGHDHHEPSSELFGWADEWSFSLPPMDEQGKRELGL